MTSCQFRAVSSLLLCLELGHFFHPNHRAVVLPTSTGDMSQHPLWMPASKDRAKPYIYHIGFFLFQQLGRVYSVDLLDDSCPGQDKAGQSVRFHYHTQNGMQLKKLKIELPYDPAIPLVGIYLEKALT